MTERPLDIEMTRYRDLSPEKAVPLLRGIENAAAVRKLIAKGLLRARNVGAGEKRARYKISREEIERFNRWTEERVREERDGSAA